jgi:hypothetical protein
MPGFKANFNKNALTEKIEKQRQKLKEKVEAIYCEKHKSHAKLIFDENNFKISGCCQELIEKTKTILQQE